MLPKQQLLWYVTPDETAGEFFSRQVSEAVPTGIFCIDQHIQVRPGQVLEVVGPTGSAKSELLAQIAANFVTTCHGEDPSSVPDNVLLIDLDSKFDPLRIVQTISARLQAHDRGALELPMKRFHLARCRNSAQFLAFLATLPQRLQSMQGKCTLLLIDNIGAFSWQDRASRPLPPPAPAAGGAGGLPGALPAPPQDRGPPLTLQQVHAAAAELLQLLMMRLRLAVVATKSAAVSWQEGGGGGGEGAQMVQREYLPLQWQRIVTHRLMLQPARPPVVEGPQGPLTHIQAQLQNDADGRREPVTSIFIGMHGMVAQSG